MSGNIDFWTDSHRREQFGAFMIDLLAHKYDMCNGRSVFMSKKTRESLDDGDFIECDDPELSSLSFPLNFERFTKPKTCKNVKEWMSESLVASKLDKEDFIQLSADGGSNAIGSVQEFEVIGREEGRSNSTDFAVCFAHQNERSGGYASGTAKFADNPNEQLGEHLKKNHEIQVFVNRAPKRMDEYNGIQTKKKRSPMIGPIIGNETHWSSMFIFVCLQSCLQLSNLN